MDTVDPNEIMICEHYKKCTDRHKQNPSEHSKNILHKDFGYYKCNLGFGIQYKHLTLTRQSAYVRKITRRCCWGHYYKVKKLKDIV